MTQTGRGEVYDIGYQHYAGALEGREGRLMALVLDGMRTALGIGRGMPSKILPALLFLALMIPALVFMIIAVFAGEIPEDLIGVPSYYGVAAIPLLIFSAIIAPELLTADRRSGILSLYLVRPITVGDYVMGRWLAFFLLSLIVVWLPQIVLFIGVTLGDSDTGRYLLDNWLQVPRFLLAGAALALFTTTLPLAVAAFINRRAMAAAFVIGLWFIAAAVGNALGNEIGGTAGSWLFLIDIGASPVDINDLIFGLTVERSGNGEIGEVPTAVLVVWYLLLVAVPAGLLWRRYRRLGA